MLRADYCLILTGKKSKIMSVTLGSRSHRRLDASRQHRQHYANGDRLLCGAEPDQSLSGGGAQAPWKPWKKHPDSITDTRMSVAAKDTRWT